MGIITYEAGSNVDVPVVTTNETVIATLSGVNTPRREDVRVSGWLQFTTGVAATAVTLRIRRGTTVADPLVGEANPVQLSAAAGSTEEHDIEVTDPGVDLAGASYALTIQQTAATGNGNAVTARVSARLAD